VGVATDDTAGDAVHARRLSVVVPTRDRPQLLADCLAALRADLGPSDEIVVADSASRGEATARVADEFGVRRVRCERPGASLARNVGWAAAVAPVVAFVDDDVRVRRGWADAAVAALDDRSVAFATGFVGVPQEEGQVDRPVAVKTEPEPAVIDMTSRGTLGASANLVVRREALVAVGGFDERLGPATWFAAAEDLDLIDRLLASGRTGRYDPAMAADHVQWRGRAARLRLDWGYGKGQGARLARLTRRDPARARALAADVVWRGTVGAAVANVRARYEYGVLAALVRLAGTVAGYLVGLGRMR
jgi:glycosyltransferase involved in cell wall biosynthesis